MTLPDDICRCHDDACRKRYTCARWVHRESGGPRTPHSWSLYPFLHQVSGRSLAADWPEPCEQMIEEPHA